MLDADGIKVTIERDQHKVLVVDDNPVTRYSTARVLRAAGFRTEEAGTGAQALELVEAGVSAVVLDVHMPDMDGFEVCAILRSQEATATLPVVHLSAEFMRDEDRVAGLNAGADAYLVHPVEPAVLVATLQALIRARTAEDRLRRSEQRFRAIYDQAPSGILLLDGQGRVVDANPAMLALLRRDRHEMLGRRIADLAPPGWRQLALMHTVTEGGEVKPWQGEFPLLDAQGVAVHLDWSMSEALDQGQRIAIASDASERMELELKRRDVLEREQAARVVAERHSRTKDDFIAVLSHELRTPLNAIAGWAAVLLRRNPTPEALKGLEAIERNVKAQARIISDILDVSRINSGKLTLQREFADPAELVAGAIASMRAAIDEKALVVEADLAQAHQPAWLDTARFQQIFWNLFTNAIKFSHAGGTIRVELRREGGLLHLAVQDHGQGIAPEFLGRLFDRFSQSDAPGNRRHGGLGLGLSIVQHLVELHGGSVRAESAGPGQGATLRVALPADPRPGAEDAPDSLREEDADGGARPLQGLDILVVEDEPDAAEMLSVVLSDRGASVRLATDYGTALAAVQARWPDVLVSDIGLPVRDGHELVREVRRLQPAGRGLLPVVALTAFARPEDRARSLEAGFDEHLGKPLKPHALVTAILALMATRRAGAPRP